MASTILTRTPSSAGNRKTMTFSAWLKRSGISTGRIFSTSYSGENNQFWIKFGSETLGVYSRTGGTYTMAFDTTAKYRDTNGWYHLVVAIDTTQSTQADRLKVYVNGSLVSGNLSTAPSLNLDVEWNVAQPNDIGGKSDTNGEYFDGLMSHVHFCDGTALAPTVFGETDATTGEWKIKTSPSFTLGTNGFTILKDGNTITDQSSNSNNFSLDSGTLTKTEDSPSNVFATINPLVGASSSATYSNGNLTVAIASSKSTASTLGAGTGKFYFETKINTVGSTYLGICSERNTGTDFSSWRPLTESALVNITGTIYNAGGSSGAKGLTSLADNDIIGCAFDVDNGKVWWSKNGQWYSGDANPTSTINISDVVAGNNAHSFSSWTGQFILGAFGTSTNANNISINFGNGYFGTSAISSAGTNASGIGIFEHDVPTGYTALSTKGLNL